MTLDVDLVGKATKQIKIDLNLRLCSHRLVKPGRVAQSVTCLATDHGHVQK